jgi:5'-deoxynucleotidase YfbR-like HD superfamily hydrolase
MNDFMYRRFRRLGLVPRWVVVPTLRQQKVDQHSYQVTQIARELLKMHNMTRFASAFERNFFELNVICYSLDHDWKEAEEGDTPSPAKIPTEIDTSDQVKVLVKCADILEAILFLEEEAAMGNAHYVRPVLDELRARFHGYWQAFDYGLGRKPITSDLIRMFVDAVLNPIHPAMEGRV